MIELIAASSLARSLSVSPFFTITSTGVRTRLSFDQINCYVPTDVPLLGDPEVSFSGYALLVFVSDLIFHTELFVARFQSRQLHSHSIWTVFVIAHSTGLASMHVLAGLAEIDKRRTDDVFVVQNVRLRVLPLYRSRNRFHFTVFVEKSL